MQEEHTAAEKRFWNRVSKIAIESGFEPSWEYLGYACSKKRLNELIERFHGDSAAPGFFGVKIPLGEINGLYLNMLIENQKELIIGIQIEDSDYPGNVITLDHVREVMQLLADSGRAWDFEAPGWIAWKTTEVRLNFRSVFNKAFQDILIKNAESEAMYLIGEEIADILAEFGRVTTRRTMEYGIAS